MKRYGILNNITSPADLKGLSYDTLGVLCAALREFIVDSVSQTGGHLASNLGIVELAVALEREFDSSRDRIIYDVGHQCYVHKILTGRRDRFSTLRQYGGLLRLHEAGGEHYRPVHHGPRLGLGLGRARHGARAHAQKPEIPRCRGHR